MKKIRRKSIHPYILIILTFIGTILLGTVFLVMPFASKSGKSFGFVDSLFMSTSAVCVTGLSVMENGLGLDMTIYGKIVMAILMEIGGLSIITITIFFFNIIGGKIGVRSSFLLRESLNQATLKNLGTLVKNIMVISFSIQIICMFINWYPFYEYLKLNGKDSLIGALGMSAFHSSASFNNAGFDILYGSESFVDFSSKAGVLSNLSVYTLNITTMFMIFTGGIGFIVIQDVIAKKRWKYFNLHTKVTLIMTFTLILLGALIIKFTCDMSWLDAFFTSITSRTAGFQTVRMSGLQDAPGGYVTVILLMFIGASPCSTGGGIKTTTMAVLFITIFNFARGKKARVFQRRLEYDQIMKAFVLVNVAIMLVFFSTFIVILIQPELGLNKVLFEVISAFSTTGLSMGITTSLNVSTRLIMVALMIFGRLGILTVIGVLNRNWLNNKTDRDIEFIKESVTVG